MKMERDFMGLQPVTVKEESPDEIYDAEPVRSTAMQWSFPNKASAAPQIMTFQGAKEDKPKTGFESLASTGLVTITTSDPSQKLYHGLQQQNTVPEMQRGGRYSATSYPVKPFDTYNITRQVNGQTNLMASPASMVHNSFAATSAQNLIGSLRPSHMSGVAMTSPVPSTRASGPLVGSTDLKTSTKISEGPAQLTIFYRGSVCVYDNIPSEKAQAIMLLAGNGPPVNSTAPPPAAPVPASPMPMSSVLDGFVVSKPYGATPRRSSPAPISPIPISVSHNAARISNDLPAMRPTGILASSSNRAETTKSINPLRSIPAAPFLSSDTVPQFRRKSLARFLEKRKERVITTSPYTDKKSPDCVVAGAGSTSMSVNSSGSCPAQPVS